MKRYIPYIVIGLLMCAIGFGVGYWKFSPKEEDGLQNVETIDSLNQVINVLQDSLRSIDGQLDVVVRDRIKWRTKYDTIVKYEDSKQIINSLNQIINTPPQ